MVLPAIRDGIIVAGSIWLAVNLRFDFNVPAPYSHRWYWTIPVAVGSLFVAGILRGIYTSVDEFTGIVELIRLAEAILVSNLIMVAFARYAARPEHYVPLTVPLIASLIMAIGLGGVRIRRRVLGHLQIGRRQPADQTRVLVLGAGQAGEMLVRDMLRNRESGYLPVGFLDDDPAKNGLRIHGIKVLGTIEQLAEVAASTDTHVALLAMPSAPASSVRRALALAASAGLKPKTVPGLDEMLDPTVSLSKVRDVDVVDLIGREPVSLDHTSLSGFVEGKTVLVTGAAGSIGSELVRQLIRFRPRTLLLLDNDETEIFTLGFAIRPIAARSDVEIKTFIRSIRDHVGIERVFETHKPDVVFHAAANKQVPMMEQDPGEAVMTNVTGTRNVAEAAIRYGAKKFVLVSTDKAVNPSSVMGATKRLAELLIATLGESSRTIFASVRFGNVLGSRGSVVPLFTEQIRQGGPITVTHPDVTRFFMTIPEAASLIIQAGALAKRGETFVLDMGEPVRIVDLAERMRDLVAREDRDRIPIVFTGLRAGEKLHEELWQSSESLCDSEHPRISRAREIPRLVLDDTTLSILELIEKQAVAHEDPSIISGGLFQLLDEAARPQIRIAR